MEKYKYKEPITIFRGDDTDFIGNRIIEISLDADIDLSGITARFELCGFTQSFDNEAVVGKRLEVVIDHDTTKTLPLGAQNGSLVLFSDDGKIKHIDTCIPFVVTNTTNFPCFTGDEQIKCELRTKISWSDIIDTPTTLEGYGIIDGATKAEVATVSATADAASLSANTANQAIATLDGIVVKTVNEQAPDDSGNVNVDVQCDYEDLSNKPKINDIELDGNKTAEDLGLVQDSDLLVLQQFYLEEKRKADPRFGCANNISVIIGTSGQRYEVVTEGTFIPSEYYGEAANDYAKEIYLAPSVNALYGNNGFAYTQKIVCYGNITSISNHAFIYACLLNFLSLAGEGQTDAVANSNVDFSMCNAGILVVIPDAYYQDETSAFWNWADYVQDGSIYPNNYLRMCNFAKASNPQRNPYIVETTLNNNGTQEKDFIIPGFQWDAIWAKKYGENYIDSGSHTDYNSLALNDICGVAMESPYNTQAILSRAYLENGLPGWGTTGVNCNLPEEIMLGDGNKTIEVVIGGFDQAHGATANVNFGDMQIDGRTLRILSSSSGYEMALSSNTIGQNLTPFVFRASRAGATFQWLSNLGRAMFTTYDAEVEAGDFYFTPTVISVARSTGDKFNFFALRIYDAFLTDAQVMEHARLDMERFNLQV